MRLKLCAAAITLAVAAACGGGTAGNGAGGGKLPAEWAASFCGAAAGLQTSLGSLSSSFQSAVGQSANLDTAKNLMVQFLTNAATSATALRDTVKALGPIKGVADGKGIQSVILQGAQKAVDVFQGAVNDANALPTDSPASFGAAATALGTKLEQGGNEIDAFFSQLDGKFKDSTAKSAFENSTACKNLQ